MCVKGDISLPKIYFCTFSQQYQIIDDGYTHSPDGSVSLLKRSQTMQVHLYVTNHSNVLMDIIGVCGRSNLSSCNANNS